MGDLLRGQDNTAIYRLVGECREQGDDHRHWRHHFLKGVAQLVGAEIVVGAEIHGISRGNPREIEGTPADWGFDEGFDIRGWQHGLELLATDPDYQCCLHRYLPLRDHIQGTPKRGSDLITADEWKRSQEYDEVYRTIGIDKNIVCFRLLSNSKDEAFGTVLCRSEGRRDFNRRELAIVEATFSQMIGLLGGDLSRSSEPSPSDLPPRARDVLRCVLEGDGDKQIAARLGISPHTVNQYLKLIYDRFHVKSRAEVMARWIRRGWKIGRQW